MGFANDASPSDQPKDLWAEAAERLSPDEQQLVQAGAKHRSQAVEEVVKEVQKQKDVCEGKRWSVLLPNGQKIVLRELLGKILGWVDKFKGTVDTLVSMDVSGHAAAPWMVIKFCLEVISSPFGLAIGSWSRKLTYRSTVCRQGHPEARRHASQHGIRNP